MLGATVPLLAASCDSNKPPPQPPEPVAAVEPEPEPEPEAPPPPPPKVPEDAFSIGTFNVDWAFDPLGDKRPTTAKPHVAPDDDTWEWKRDRIVDVLVAEKLDIVVLVELGGERELTDITSSVTTKEGPDYQYAWVPGEDKRTGRHVAILSRFPIKDERRTDAYAPIHVAAEVELPTGDEITVIAMHLKEGSNKGAVKQRNEMAKSLKRRVTKAAKKRPVILLGTLGDKTLPYDNDYKQSASGMLSGEATKQSNDNCEDSAAETLAQSTTIGGGEALDRIFSCGLVMRGAETSGRDIIVREQEDPADTPWPSVAVDKEPHRDVSDHLVVWAEIALPKKPGAEDGAGKAEAKAEAKTEAGGEAKDAAPAAAPAAK
ncbi:MAG: endonuclease/exonuclease/phosphatase family protein [Myxococcota bacterium]